MLAATVATLSSASKRPAPSSASPSGTTLAQGSQSQPPQRSHTCQNSSPRAPVRPDPATGFAPLTLAVVMTVIIVLLPPEPWQTVRPAALLLPILLWLTARCQPVFAAAAAFIVSLTTVWTITFGIGHFGDPGLPIGDRILDAQAAIVAFTLYAYVLAALFAERRRSETRLQEALAAGAVTAFEWNP